MKAKIFVSFVVIAMIVLLITRNEFGDTLKPNASIDVLNSENEGVSEIDKVTKNELATLSIKKTLSFEEMYQYMKDKGYSHKQIHNFKLNHKNDNLKRSNSTIKYTILRLDGWSYGETDGDKGNYSIVPELIVSLDYYRNSSTPDRIVSVGLPSFDNSGGDDCSFYGQFDYKLVAGNEIFTALRGYLYEGGNIDWEDDTLVQAEEEEMTKLNLSGEYGTSLTYVSHPESYYSSDMQR